MKTKLLIVKKSFTNNLLVKGVFWECAKLLCQNNNTVTLFPFDTLSLSRTLIFCMHVLEVPVRCFSKTEIVITSYCTNVNTH